ncbi:MAG: hypothetical protein A2X37_11755 [Elusimicrobia bacterium GWA2_66_18]|nr:MAG: hypothetical protein A2X37_11755 [Elusimicrobia bacterium GWA2_66_18]
MAATAAGAKAGLGWLILAAALAVPGFLFFNWWSNLKAERDRAVSTKARGRIPEGNVFQTAPATRKPVNPLAASTAAPATAALKVAPVAPPPPADAAAPPAAVPSAPLPAAADVAVSSSPAATIVLPRDPMLSPLDLVYLREAEIAKERARREIEEANRLANRPPVKRVKPPVEKMIELQGIVATPGGVSLAIVNGTTVSSGESFSVAGYDGKVRVLKISTMGVTFEHKRRRFMKNVNNE